MSDNSWRGDTWWFSDKECPECSKQVATNGTVYKCDNCGWSD